MCDEPGTGANGADALPRTIEQKLADFVSDADVLICDAQYSAGEYADARRLGPRLRG